MELFKSLGVRNSENLDSYENLEATFTQNY